MERWIPKDKTMVEAILNRQVRSGQRPGPGWRRVTLGEDDLYYHWEHRAIRDGSEAADTWLKSHLEVKAC